MPFDESGFDYFRPWPPQVDPRGSAGVGCTDWFKTQRPAYFRGIPFAVESDTIASGRRVVSHQFPSRDSWANEDLGIMLVTAEVQAYVFGDRAHQWADELMQACLANDPPWGPLSLPLRQPAVARCTGVSSRFQAAALGRIDFELRFTYDAPPPKLVLPPVLMGGRVDASAQQLRGAAKTHFRKKAVKAYPVSAYHGAAAEVKEIGRRLSGVANSVPMSSKHSSHVHTLIKILRTESDAVAFAFKNQSNFLADEGTGSGQSVVEYITRHDYAGLIESIFDMLAAGVREKKESDILARTLDTVMSGHRPATVLGTSSSALAEQDLRKAVVALARRFSLAHQASLLADVTGRDLDLLTDVEKRFLVRVDTEFEEANDDVPVRTSLSDMTDRWTKYASTQRQRSRGVRKVEVQGPIATVLANLNVPIDQGDRELMTINKKRHPLHIYGSISVVQ